MIEIEKEDEWDLNVCHIHVNHNIYTLDTCIYIYIWSDSNIFGISDMGEWWARWERRGRFAIYPDTFKFTWIIYVFRTNYTIKFDPHIQNTWI